MGVAALLSLPLAAIAAGRIEVAGAWIRNAPPGAMMLAGYAVLRNSGDIPVVINGAESDDFGDVSLHQSVEENGVERMRPLGRVSIGLGEKLAFAPGGRHFMLMRPKRELKIGDIVRINIVTETGERIAADFLVRETAP